MAGKEDLIHKAAIKSKMAIIALVHTDVGPLIAFKIANITMDNDEHTTIVANSDGSKQLTEFYLRDIDRARTLADIIRVGRPLPYGIPYKVGTVQRGSLQAPRQDVGASDAPEYTADRIISLATNTANYLRTCRFVERPEYGNALQMEIVVRDAKSTASRPRVMTYDYSQFESMVAFGALARVLAKL